MNLRNRLGLRNLLNAEVKKHLTVRPLIFPYIKLASCEEKKKPVSFRFVPCGCSHQWKRTTITSSPPPPPPPATASLSLHCGIVAFRCSPSPHFIRSPMLHVTDGGRITYLRDCVLKSKMALFVMELEWE
ncbi:hypothetical protein PoB_005496900 [Plakobranchus ocellatus]|uniref:Uncharacterized protein n=1 Tax=Plakobranchus ocellatus TaxID=259542 RepID=A0AAV4CBJ5_9GAST|nr:hypothetical protein PoB_005496900 [Plakobranchus ocellatus]